MKIMKTILASILLSTLLTMAISCKKADTPSCGTINGLISRNISTSSVAIRWNSNGAIFYDIQYRVVGTATWLTTSSFVDSITLTGLNYNSNYEWQVKSTCANTPTSAFSASGNFTTTGCPSGYEGPNCSTRLSTKFAGTYSMTDSFFSSSSPVGVFPFSMTISEVFNNPSAITITNFAAYGTDVTATVTGNTFIVPTYTATTSTIVVTNGKGTINGNNISITYTATDPNSSANSGTGHDVGSK